MKPAHELKGRTAGENECTGMGLQSEKRERDDESKQRGAGMESEEQEGVPSRHAASEETVRNQEGDELKRKRMDKEVRHFDAVSAHDVSNDDVVGHTRTVLVSLESR
jgi:hypothetical protein